MRSLITLAFVLVMCLALGCTMPGRKPGPYKTPLEQGLLSLAIERSAEKVILGLPEGSRVVLDSSGLSKDHRYVAEVMEGWLGRQGLVTQGETDGAQYRLRMIVQSVGNAQSIVFLGLFASRLMWFPVVLPEIALYKKDRQAGFARLYFDIFDATDGRYLRSTAPVEGEFHQTRYTALLIIKWRTGDEPSSPPADFEQIDIDQEDP